MTAHGFLDKKRRMGDNVLSVLCFGLWLVALFGLLFIVLCFTTTMTQGWIGMESAGPLFIIAMVAAIASAISAVLLRRLNSLGVIPSSGSWFPPAVYTVLAVYTAFVFIPLLLAAADKLVNG